MTQPTKLSDLADAMIENYWLLCSPQQAVANALGEYVRTMECDTPYLYGDDTITPEQFLKALNEMVGWFMTNTSEWKA